MNNGPFSRTAHYALCVSLMAVSIGYIFVIAHTPISVLAGALHDDGLFIHLGREIANLKWLGPFSQFTLMKGPGYPLFLALSNWSGLSISVAQAIFHCIAVVLFAAVVHLLAKSLFISCSTFLLLLWQPYSMEVLRLLRDNIYYGQVLILLATAAYSLFRADIGAQRNIVAALAGGVLGWCWLTREEGAWLLPGIGVMVILAVLRAWREGRVRQIAAALFSLVVVFAATQMSFYAINWHIYGKFVGVDVKEPNFQRALAALQSVRTGGVIPFVSVTHATRERIYSVSPTFATLFTYLDTPAGADFKQFSCRSNAAICGEIGAGWFLWALRDAAAASGNYSSPSKASAFFGKIANEVSAACATGALKCEPQLLAEMPPWTWNQVLDTAYQRYAKAFTRLIWPTPSRQASNSIGPLDTLTTDLYFLNYPRHTQTGDDSSILRISGWFYQAGTAWLSIQILKSDGSLYDAQVVRNPSPDIASHFNDPMATNQRFTIQTYCGDDCVIELQPSDAPEVKRRLSDLLSSPMGFAVGAGQFYVDTAVRAGHPEYVATAPEKVARELRAFVLAGYNYLFIPFLLIGAVAFMAVTLVSWRGVLWNASYVLALSSWLLVFTRVTLLVFIDATSFPALNRQYLGPAYFLLITGASLSCAAWAQLWKASPADAQ